MSFFFDLFQEGAPKGYTVWVDNHRHKLKNIIGRYYSQYLKMFKRN